MDVGRSNTLCNKYTKIIITNRCYHLKKRNLNSTMIPFSHILFAALICSILKEKCIFDLSKLKRTYFAKVFSYP